MKKDLTFDELIIKAALSLSKGDLKKSFSAEDLLVEAWKKNKSSFGLRGHEDEYPYSNKIYKKIDGKNGLVERGLLKKNGQRVYKLTEVCLSIGISLEELNKEEYGMKLERQLNENISKIINHEVFKKWLEDPEQPKRFREAGWFWGIAPGTPPSVVKERLQEIDNTLKISEKSLKSKNAKKIFEQKGKILFDEDMLNKCSEFNESLKKRFEKDLNILLEN